MTRVVFFDLGDTLEANDELRPGALETLSALRDLRDAGGAPVPLGLISDYDMPTVAEDVPKLRAEYLAILSKLGIREFFQPEDARVTLSTEVGEYKPARKVFRTAIDKIAPGAHFHSAIFITENAAHVAAARKLGMLAIQLRAPEAASGEVQELPELVPLLRRYLEFEPCGKSIAKAKGRYQVERAPAKALDPQIKALTERVDEARLLATVSALSDFGTRWSFSPQIAQVNQWVKAQFVACGYAPEIECRFQDFELPGAGTQQNVLASKGSTDDGIVLVCCHYDSISEHPGELAPGADDNASGVAAVLELSRLLADVPLQRQVLFCAFGGEEQGLFGSGACAEVAKRDGWPIHAVINLDMVGSRTREPPTIVVEYDQGNRNPENDDQAKELGRIMARAAHDYTSLAVEHTDIWSSDYMPFEAKGFACIGAYEGGENPHYHRTTDTLDRVDGAYLAQVTRMVLATIMQIARH